jgi:hypothetical protein
MSNPLHRRSAHPARPLPRFRRRPDRHHPAVLPLSGRTLTPAAEEAMRNYLAHTRATGTGSSVLDHPVGPTSGRTWPRCTRSSGRSVNASVSPSRIGAELQSPREPASVAFLNEDTAAFSDTAATSACGRRRWSVPPAASRRRR